MHRNEAAKRIGVTGIGEFHFCATDKANRESPLYVNTQPFDRTDVDHPDRSSQHLRQTYGVKELGWSAFSVLPVDGEPKFVPAEKVMTYGPEALGPQEVVDAMERDVVVFSAS